MMMELRSELGLVADIGGTNVRFALVPTSDDAPLTLQNVNRYQTADYASFAEAAAIYLRDHCRAGRPRCAAIAVAGIVRGDQVRITNCPWQFTLSGLRHDLDLQHLHALNDFAAVAHAVPALQPHEQIALGGHWSAPVPERGSFAVLGPGTGLGVGGVRRAASEWLVLDSEGGHCAFAPVGEEELALLADLQRRFGRVSYERLLSGQGLANIYAALKHNGAEALPPEQITALALGRQDATCGKAVRMFCEVLGSFAGDTALMLGAWDGVYLAGGLIDVLREPLCALRSFRERFEAKGRFASALASVPTFAIAHPNPGLLGASVALRRSLRAPVHV